MMFIAQFCAFPLPGGVVFAAISGADVNLRCCIGSIGLLLCIPLGLYSVINPYSASLFGERWKYKDPENLEPSAEAIFMTRLVGIFGLLVGIGMLLLAFLAPSQGEQRAYFSAQRASHHSHAAPRRSRKMPPAKPDRGQRRQYLRRARRAPPGFAR